MFKLTTSDQTPMWFQPFEVHFLTVICYSSSKPCFSDATGDIDTLVWRELVPEFQIHLTYLRKQLINRAKQFRGREILL